MPPEPAPRASDRGQRTLRALADELLEEHRVEYIDDGALTVMPPAGFTHARILRILLKAFDRAFDTGATGVEWDLRSENFQFDLADQPR